jgi:2-dehydro-3-deoxygalactonokinase
MPGLTDRSAKPFPDVMRGEETQLVGLGLDRDRLVVLPGTHCKWAHIGEGRILRFRTLVTGEMFANLSRHSFIVQMAKPQPEPDWAAFGHGLDAARDPAVGAGLLSRLFSVRTGWLAGALKAEEASDYLSGLILGSEFREVAELGWFEAGDDIVIVGGERLVELYSRAAAAFDLTPRAGPPDASVRGCLAIAQSLEGAQNAAR